MKFNEFRTLCRDAADANDANMFIAEIGWQDWFNEYENQLDYVNFSLNKIFDISKLDLDITKLRAYAKMRRAEFSRLTGIPTRTIENWDAGVAAYSEYIYYMIAFIVFTNLQEDFRRNDIN